jgi:hypothetical protein
MILGVDHIALACTDVYAASNVFEKAGYTVRFIEEDAPNRPVKQPFLKTYQPLHSLAFCVAPSGIAIELTGHGNTLIEGESPYQVLLGAMPPQAKPVDVPDPNWGPVWSAALGCAAPRAADWVPLRAPVWADADGAPGVRAVLLGVTDAGTAADFWQVGLGCKQTHASALGDGRRWVHLAFRAPVPNWSLDLILAEREQPLTPPWLDTAGFPCLVMLTSSLARDGDRLMEAGAVARTGVFEVGVNDKPLQVEVFRGTSGEFIELIQVNR